MNRFLILIFCLLFSSAAIVAQEMPVPVEIQIRLLFKILTFDRNLHTRSGDTLKLGILYQKHLKSSSNTKNALVQVLTESSPPTIESIPFTYITLDVQNINEVLNQMLETHIDILYLAPLRGIDITEIISFCARKKILTCTGIPEYVDEGVILGFDLINESPKILVNLEMAKTSGVDFNSQLLKLSKIIK